MYTHKNMDVVSASANRKRYAQCSMEQSTRKITNTICIPNKVYALLSEFAKYVFL